MGACRRINKPKCECGRAVVEGSVYCLCCRAAIKRKNSKILSNDKILFARKN